ncbi:LysM peptidoglycan-binding domain-containing protein [Lutibacter sp. HS1-25]|uniref:LysM peptidoglycan-binding domain-containing protein n=1 Tax=Lutibacter sp. HS1-25 TaxID=2485000 RepID=UPI0010133A78|nr:LysM peptidoglycan-binding domain-containing protein [Lutibacter sp. HS1-25]RXP56148.1 LysM peptidoglycan-binding domain-containing protein [Lutibacter sp. HS1-25]
MRKIQLLITFLFLITAIVYAQDKKYISYEVKKNETLKSIASDYNMSTKDLSKLNPGVSRKPVLGTIIIVPNKNFGKVISTTVVNEPKKYIVQPKETLYGISKKFGVSIDQLQNANPTLVNGLKIGMELVIPVVKASVEEVAQNYVTHTVVKDDTVYNLTKRFGVSEADLYALNPKLKEGLKLGMVLKMKPTAVKETSNEPIVEHFKAVSSHVNKASFEENINLNKEINVAIILPYQLNKLNDSILDQNFAKNNLLKIATDFHMGAQLAIDSLKSKGLNVKVTYFDSENSDQKLQSLLAKNQNFSNVDFVIGPLFFDNAHWISKHIKQPVIAPLYSKKQDDVNQQNLIKTAPKSDLNQQKLLAYLEENYAGENVVVVNDGKAETQSQLWQIVNKINGFKNVHNVSVIKPQNGYINRSVFSLKISKTNKNWVIIVSDDNVTTSATINGLKGFSEDVEIDLYALNKGKNFDNIENVFLGKLNFTYPTSEFIDTENEEINYFYNAFYVKNKAYPSKYALRGFDVTYDMLVRYASNNGNLDKGLNAGWSTRVSGIFQYSKNDFGSFDNNGLYIIRYTENLVPIIMP